MKWMGGEGVGRFDRGWGNWGFLGGGGWGVGGVVG